MALTDYSNLVATIDEAALNRFVRHMRRQRPSLFNYGTALFLNKPRLLCRQIDVHREVIERGNALITEEDPWPIPGTDGEIGLDFCLQVQDLVFDLHPSSMELPPELPKPLPEQRLAIGASICVGIGCPDARTQQQIADDLSNQTDNKASQRPPPSKPATIPTEGVACFCLQVYAVAHVGTVGPANASRLAFLLDALEIVDIDPPAVENVIECFLSIVLRVGVLPQMQIALERFTFDLGEYGHLWLAPTPISAAVPYNPSIANDEIRFFIDAGSEP